MWKEGERRERRVFPLDCNEQTRGGQSVVVVKEKEEKEEIRRRE